MTVALIDDDAAVLDSLRMSFGKRGIDVRCFTSAEEFLAGLEAMAPSCVVSDVRMPGLSGLELQRELIRRDSAVPLILITGHGDIAMAVDALKLGAADFLEKPFDNEKLAAAIRAAIVRGERQRIRHDERANLMSRIAELSQRQRQVMDLVVKGLANKEIALRLDISPRTVENYRAWVMEKMGAANLADLVRMVVQLEASEDTAPAAGSDRSADP